MGYTDSRVDKLPTWVEGLLWNNGGDDSYCQALNNALVLLAPVTFGGTLGEWNATPSTDDFYDKSSWETIFDVQSKQVILSTRKGVKPSEAVVKLIANPGSWRVDCAQLVQLCHLLALYEFLGSKKLNKLLSSSSSQFPYNCWLKQHDSSWAFTSHLKKGDKLSSLEEQVSGYPCGSLVGVGRPGFFQNAVKLGSSIFGAIAENSNKRLYTLPELLEQFGFTTGNVDAVTLARINFPISKALTLISSQG